MVSKGSCQIQSSTSGDKYFWYGPTKLISFRIYVALKLHVIIQTSINVLTTYIDIRVCISTWTTKLSWTVDSFENFENAVFFKDISNSFRRVTRYGLKTLQFFLFRICQQIWSLGAFKVLAKMGRSWQTNWAIAKFLHQIIKNLYL